MLYQGSARSDYFYLKVTTETDTGVTGITLMKKHNIYCQRYTNFSIVEQVQTFNLPWLRCLMLCFLEAGFQTKVDIRVKYWLVCFGVNVICLYFGRANLHVRAFYGSLNILNIPHWNKHASLLDSTALSARTTLFKHHFPVFMFYLKSERVLNRVKC